MMGRRWFTGLGILDEMMALKIWNHLRFSNRFATAAKPLPCSGIRVFQSMDAKIAEHDDRLVPIEPKEFV